MDQLTSSSESEQPWHMVSRSWLLVDLLLNVRASSTPINALPCS